MSGPTWATGDEPCLLLVGHGDEVSRWRILPSHETADSRPHCGRGPAIQSDYPAGCESAARQFARPVIWIRARRRRDDWRVGPYTGKAGGAHSIPGVDGEVVAPAPPTLRHTSYLRIEERELEAGGLNLAAF